MRSRGRGVRAEAFSDPVECCENAGRGPKLQGRLIGMPRSYILEVAFHGEFASLREIAVSRALQQRGEVGKIAGLPPILFRASASCMTDSMPSGKRRTAC